MVRLGSSEARSLRLANQGLTPLEIISIDCPAGFAADTSDLPLTLNPGASQERKVLFVPAAAQDYGGNIQITTGAGPESRACTGRGVAVPPELMNWSISSPIHFDLGALFSEHGTVVSSVGLPKGVTFDANTSTLAGVPPLPGVYQVSILIEQPDGTKWGLLVPVSVEALPGWAVGSFTALINPPTTEDPTLLGLGGYLSLSSSASSVFTGSLTLGAKKFAFKGQVQGRASV